MKKDITTIKISKKVVGELSLLKVHPRQAYEEVIVKLIEAYKKDKTAFGEEISVGKKEITTIKISKNTVKELSLLKVHPRQAYEEVIVKLIENYKKNG
jgi:hypothetical protein